MFLEPQLISTTFDTTSSIAMPHSRPMPHISFRCHELRVWDQNKAWRLIYRTDEDRILIVEVFSKSAACFVSPTQPLPFAFDFYPTPTPSNTSRTGVELKNAVCNTSS